MTTLTLMPSLLAGTVTAPSSKSMGHRFLICAALAQGESWIRDVSFPRILPRLDAVWKRLVRPLWKVLGKKAEKPIS